MLQIFTFYSERPLFSAVKYEDTNDYYWPLISTKDDTAYVSAEKKALALPDTRGPFGFGDAVQLKENKVR